MYSMDNLTSVVFVEKRILLVPLSKMMVRGAFKREFVLPFIASPGEVSSQCEPPAAAAREANIGVPSQCTRYN
jgi:hypothetical protein